MSTVAIGPTTQVGGRVSVQRHFTASEHDPYAGLTFKKCAAKISDPDGSVVFQMDNIEVPTGWSEVATNVVASKYFRKGGVPVSAVDHVAIVGGAKVTGAETSVRQLIDRVVFAIEKAGVAQGYFDQDNAAVFGAELRYLLVRQYVAFNSPVWFNCGLAESYGIEGDPAGNYAFDAATKTCIETKDGFSRPQVSACFIRAVKDDLMEIAEGIKTEMRLFKYGSGVGANFSPLRAKNEKLSGGGTSSGVRSFLKVYDAAAGSIKSGGTTRRAAKMVVLNADHPDIEDFVEWKVEEEKKVLALHKAGYHLDFNGEAYRTVDGQNANNSVRVTDEFMKAALNGGMWETKYRTTGKVAKTMKAADLLRKIVVAAHTCADPGMQFDTTCNKWNTVPETGRINATNPCSEFSFLDETACNLSSFNLIKFIGQDGAFDTEGFVYAVDTLILAMDILVDYASYPTKALAENSHALRPLGLGYANLGALLMQLGIAYDSNEGYGICAAITSLMAAASWRRSAEIAKSKGPFAAYAHNREHALRVARMHARENGLRDYGAYSMPISAVAKAEWESAIALGEMSGFRNAQLTLIAPTGTIGFLMDCDTTGIEPDFALVKYKKLAGRGMFKIVNQSVAPALDRLGYDVERRNRIVGYIDKHDTIEGSPDLDPKHLSVFDCATQCGESGKRFIAPMAHIKMMAAAQPFLCGAISKTINMPGDATVDDVQQVYVEAWRLGLKAIAIYRDGSKHCQVLSGKKDKKVEPAPVPAVDPEAKARADYEALGMGRDPHPMPTPASGQPRPVLAPPPAPARKRLPKRRRGFTQEATIGGQKVYLRTGEYDDGKLGEVFIDMAKAGSTIEGLLNTIAILTSLGLQHGVPLDEYVDAFTFTKFEPSGPVQGDPNVKNSLSIMDYIFRTLAINYLDRFDLAHIPPNAVDAIGKLAKRVEPKAQHDGKTDKIPLPHVNGNGNGTGGKITEALALAKTDAARSALKQLFDEKPAAHISLSGQPCPVCGNETIRVATCASCLTCGATTGCG